MSKMCDDLKNIDAQQGTTSNIISQALNKKDRNGYTAAPPEPPPAQPKVSVALPSRRKRWGVRFLLGVGMIGVVVLLFARTIGKVDTIFRQMDQLGVILEMRTEELGTLQEHVQAVEAEFRRAFQKDREQMTTINTALSQKDVELAAQNEKTVADFTAALAPSQLQITQHQASLDQIERRTADLFERLGQVENEISALQAVAGNPTATQ